MGLFRWTVRSRSHDLIIHMNHRCTRRFVDPPVRAPLAAPPPAAVSKPHLLPPYGSLEAGTDDERVQALANMIDSMAGKVSSTPLSIPPPPGIHHPPATSAASVPTIAPGAPPPMAMQQGIAGAPLSQGDRGRHGEERGGQTQGRLELRILFCRRIFLFIFHFAL